MRDHIKSFLIFLLFFPFEFQENIFVLSNISSSSSCPGGVCSKTTTTNLDEDLTAKLKKDRLTDEEDETGEEIDGIDEEQLIGDDEDDEINGDDEEEEENPDEVSDEDEEEEEEEDYSKPKPPKTN